MTRVRFRQGRRLEIPFAAYGVTSAVIGTIDLAPKYNAETQAFVLGFDDTAELPAGTLSIKFKATARGRAQTESIELETF